MKNLKEAIQRVDERYDTVNDYMTLRNKTVAPNTKKEDILKAMTQINVMRKKFDDPTMNLPLMLSIFRDILSNLSRTNDLSTLKRYTKEIEDLAKDFKVEK